tara:strand:+ start:138 stop:1007 length:870 start_codon:yes stop_codon:yes gene_type:complete
MSKTGFKLPGSLTATMTSTTDMSETLKAKTINFAKKETDRVAGANQGTFTAPYYIMATYDINGKITYTGSSASSGADDGYSLTGFQITSANASSPVLYLPTGSSSIKAGTITAKDTVGAKANREFAVNMAIGISNQGAFENVSVSITGATLTESITDDPNKAQVAYWDTSTPADPSATTADTLSASLSASALNTKYTNERASIAALYTGSNANQISSWSMSITAVANSNENVLAKHATFKDRSGSDIFAAGDMIVAATPLSYSIKIKDVDDVDKTIVSSTNVYGVVKQS